MQSLLSKGLKLQLIHSGYAVYLWNLCMAISPLYVRSWKRCPNYCKV